MNRKRLAVYSVVCMLALLSVAAIKFFTDYPNAVPLDSDFFVYQRNQTYGNASGAQTKSYFWANPQFTGNGSIQGAFGVGGFETVGGNIVVNGIYYGNGAGLTNIATSVFFLATNGIGSTPTFYGTSTFVGNSPTNGIISFFDVTGTILLGGFDGTNFFGALTNIVGGANVTVTPHSSGATAYLVISSSGSSTNSSTVATNMYTYKTNFDGYIIVTNALQALNVTVAPSIAGFDASDQLTNINTSARFTFSANTLDLATGVATPGTYRSVTVDTYGRTTAGTDPTTFSGYAISDTSANFLSALSDDQFIQYDTNSIPSSGVFTFRHSYFTNMQHDITMPAFTIVDATKYESFVLIVTNSDSSTHAWTVPAGCRVAIANGGGNKLYCTNGTMTSIYVEHYGVLYTNAWKNDY